MSEGSSNSILASPARAGPLLASLADQTDPQVIRRTLLTVLDEVCVMSRGRERTSVDGKKTWADPDHGSMLKAVELAAKITGAIGLDPDALLRFKGAAEELVRRAEGKLQEREAKGVLTVAVSGEQGEKL